MNSNVVMTGAPEAPVPVVEPEPAYDAVAVIAAAMEALDDAAQVKVAAWVAGRWGGPS